jgi:hypothetical protein
MLFLRIFPSYVAVYLLAGSATHLEGIRLSS